MTDDLITVYVVETEYGRFTHDDPEDAARTSRMYQRAPITTEQMTRAKLKTLPAYE